ncbi:FAD-dependent thymidylate synthase [Clostridium sp. UBA4548]|uniref:FAD-dependent thymidylate synthase n=1 Tax=Clostridium sp. UBA4548 TaxID=1946361 RepID=UPI0025B9323D|nr:FAD-dependent thymidylate synthase [Clostridium sp. UBA4548]
MKVKVKLVQFTPEPEKTIASAAKLCYSAVGVEDIAEGLTEEKTSSFINMLASYGHYSPMEHVSFTFAIEGVSRSLTHQLVRHRIASYSQQSQRYVKLKAFEYIMPPAIEQNEEAKKIFVEAMKKDQEDYDKLATLLTEVAFQEYIEQHRKHSDSKVDLDEKTLKSLRSKAEKKAIEDARYVFPNACETKIMATMNARELMNFFSHRCCNRAQWEIRELADEMLRLVKSVAPNLFKYCGPNCIREKCPEGTMTCGQILQVREKYSNL